VAVAVVPEASAQEPKGAMAAVVKVVRVTVLLILK
jgi:hypothetical protein